MIRIYLDACCLNRPFDDQTHDRIRLEAEAVLLILSHVEAGQWQLIGSEVMMRCTLHAQKGEARTSSCLPMIGYCGQPRAFQRSCVSRVENPLAWLREMVRE